MHMGNITHTDTGTVMPRRTRNAELTTGLESGKTEEHRENLYRREEALRGWLGYVV